MSGAKKPKGLKDCHLDFLEDLRDTSTINMFGAAPQLAERFNISKTIAHTYLNYWLDSSNKRTQETH